MTTSTVSEKHAHKILFVSFEGLIGDLAYEVTKRGHHVKYYIKDKAEQDVCDGFVEKCEDWKKEIDWADVVVFDDIGFGKEADDLRKAGKRVVGGSVYTDRIEDDRDFGQEELKNAGVNIIPSWNFTNFDSAIAFLKEHPDRYVIKPSGKVQNEKQLLFVGLEEDGKDILEMLERYKKNWANKIKQFQIQKYVSGVEVAVGAFFDGEEFVGPINVNFEHKKLFPGDLGFSTGEMGTHMFFTAHSPIFEGTLGRMKTKLAQSGYVGYVDVNCIVNGRGMYPLEFTSRFGYPHISIMLEGILSDMGHFLYELASKHKPELRTKRGLIMGVVVAVPPFPFKDADTFKKYSEDAQIIFKKQVTDGMHLGDVKLVDGDWRLAGQSGYALVITGSGSTMEEARSMAYNRVKSVTIPNMFYRIDIATRWNNDSDRLQTWGFL